jgi:uncharacterized membrane protein (UPF0127 family)
VRFLIVVASVAALVAAGCAGESPSDSSSVETPQAAPAAPAEPAAGPAAVALPADAPRVEPGPTEPLEIATAGGPVKLEVEIADEPREREQGLMWRGSMPADHGMLFDFKGGGREGELSFWMRNTYIPLDIIYIRADGRIHSIARNTVPLDETPVPSGGPVAAVLEINGGLAERLGINPGDRVRHRIFR